MAMDGGWVKGQRYLNRELSWIAFNQRVLELAVDAKTPLLEQAKFSAIFSNNLDEFFMVRVASLIAQVESQSSRCSIDGRSAEQQLEAIQKRLEPLLKQQQQHLNRRLRPQLERRGIGILDHRQLSRRQKDWLASFFRNKIQPVLTATRLNTPGIPFPFISSLSLNLAVEVRGQGSGNRELIRIKLPKKNSPRFITLPEALHGERSQAIHLCVPLEQVMEHNLKALLPGRQITSVSVFRVTRDADLALREEEAEDLMEAMQTSLRRRTAGGEVVRLELSAGTPAAVQRQLTAGMGVPRARVNRVDGLLGLDDLMELQGINAPTLKQPPFRGSTPAPLQRCQSPEEGRQASESIFRVIRRGDVLLHHPFDRFETTVEEFIHQASLDPSVQAIKITLYRVSKDSPIIASLIAAAEEGKQVLALVELKARFDEDNNIRWARQLERSGVHVVYGVIGLKTHTKIALVIRREKGTLQAYSHVGTGNYNSKTAALYTDLGLLSADPALGQDLISLFNYLTGFSKQSAYRKLLVAPTTLRAEMLKLIDREIEHARAGLPSGIKAKMNALVDQGLIDKLYDASAAGVKIELIVRGACSCTSGIAGLSETIRVRSIVGRFLEHSRLFWFENNDQPQVWFGSADWMPRNLDRRVEAVVPVENQELVGRIQQLLELYLQDNQASWHLQSDGRYRAPEPAQGGSSAQGQLMRGV